MIKVCKNCQWYCGRRWGYFCRVKKKHVNPYDTCTSFTLRRGK